MKITAAQVVDRQPPRWTPCVVLERMGQVRRGLPLPGAVNGATIVARVSNAARLDPRMRQQLIRILTVTVQDWMRQ